jgi:hypothetical protein
MRVTSGEFSVREPNRQGHECWGSAEHRHGAILVTGDRADCSTSRAARMSVLLSDGLRLAKFKTLE